MKPKIQKEYNLGVATKHVFIHICSDLNPQGHLFILNVNLKFDLCRSLYKHLYFYIFIFINGGDLISPVRMMLRKVVMRPGMRGRKLFR